MVHLISDAGPHPYFETFMSRADHDRFRYLVGCVGPPGSLQEEMRGLGVETFSLNAQGSSSLPSAIGKLSRRLRGLGAEAIQTHLPLGSAVGLPAARVARTPLAIHTAHHSHELPYHGWRLRAFERLMAGKLAHRVSAPSRQVAKVLADTGIPGSKIEVIHHGFDLERFDPNSANGAKLRDQLGVSEDATVIGTIGREFFLKNTDALVEAFTEVARMHPEDLQLVIVHRGDSPQTRELIANSPAADRVHLLNDRGDIADLLAAFDLYVHPAIAESFGMTIIEAMAAARPVVTTPVGIAPEVIRDGENGWLAWDSSVTGLREAIERSLQDRQGWRDVGRTARADASAFPVEAMVHAHERLYSSANLRRSGDQPRVPYEASQ